MNVPKVEWLLDCDPRPVQEEALLRSYYGWKSREGREEERTFEQIRDGGPAIGWGHLLEMRLGKTPTILAETALLEKYQNVNRRIIFSPNAYKYTWASEVPKFGLLTPAHPFETSNIKEAEAFLERSDNSGFYLIVNYEALIYDHARKFIEQLLGEGSVLICDESIKIKNRTSNFGKYALEMGVEAEYVRISTGLPMTQGPQDLYSQLRFIRMLNGVNFYAFRGKYCLMGGFKGKKVKGVKNEDKLQELIASRNFVAKRKDWGRITEPEHYHQYLQMDPEQKKYYDQMDQEFMIMIEEQGEEITADQVVTKLMKLQQISSGFVYNEHGDIVQLLDPKKTPKFLALKEILDNEVTNKVIIPYHYSASGDMLMEALKEYNPAVIRSGQWMRQNNVDVDAEKQRFNEDPKCRVILLQIQAGKYGHTLTGVEGDRCTHMFFFENTYSLDDREQIEMRNTAETQDWVNVYMDFVSSPVELNAVTALQRKEDLVTAVFGSYNPNKKVEVINGDQS